MCVSVCVCVRERERGECASIHQVKQCPPRHTKRPSGPIAHKCGACLLSMPKEPAHSLLACLRLLASHPLTHHTAHPRQQGNHCRLFCKLLCVPWSCFSLTITIITLLPTQNTAHTDPCPPRQEEPPSLAAPGSSSSSPSSSSHRPLSKPACRRAV